ncbi:MAG: hypothetical protein ACI4PQ_08700 [Butyricicoccaceae bacterium]
MAEYTEREENGRCEDGGSEMKVLIALLGILVVLSTLICYACCVAAGLADDEMERMIEDVSWER